MMEELHPDEIEAVLHRHCVGRLACVVDGWAYVVPITCAYAGGAIYGETVPGRRLDAMRADPRVGFEVDERWEPDLWRSVVAEAEFEELTDEVARQQALRHLAGTMPDASRTMGGVVFRLHLTATSGRAVRRAAPFARFDDAATPLQGVDLRAGDEQNFPRRPDS